MLKHKIADIALEIASNAHKGVKDRGGNAYILHPLHVANTVKHLGIEFWAVGVLHDVIEDTDENSAINVTKEYLIEKGIPENIAEAVDVISKRVIDGVKEDYDVYLERVKGNVLAKIVKIADIEHNSDLNRLHNEPTDKDLKRLAKYRNALHYLKS